MIHDPLKFICCFDRCGIQGMAETGFLNALQRKYRMPDVCSAPVVRTKATGPELSKVITAFVVFDFGITASVIVLFVEVYCKDPTPMYFITVLVIKLRIEKH